MTARARRGKLMDNETLRQDIMADADKVTDSRIASWQVGRETVRRIRAMRRYWESASAAELNRLSALLDQEPRR